MLKNEKGQALFEFITFLPLMLMIYTLSLSVNNSIFGSINQNKIARGYFFANIRSNPTIPNNSTLDNGAWDQSWGHFFIGWAKDVKGGKIPVSTCFKVISMFKPIEDDSCEDSPGGGGIGSGATTQFIRPTTVFGLCGETYFKNGNEVLVSVMRDTVASCLIQ